MTQPCYLVVAGAGFQVYGCDTPNEAEDSLLDYFDRNVFNDDNHKILKVWVSAETTDNGRVQVLSKKKDQALSNLCKNCGCPNE